MAAASGIAQLVRETRLLRAVISDSSILELWLTPGIDAGNVNNLTEHVKMVLGSLCCGGYCLLGLFPAGVAPYTPSPEEIKTVRAWPFFFVVFAIPLPAQDPAVVSPKIIKVEFENDRVRILRVHYGPHDRTAMHSHPAELVVRVTDGWTRATYPDGTARENKGAAGAITWPEPTTHAVENLKDEPLENVEIEFKKVSAPSVPVSAPHPPSMAPAADAVVSLIDEPHHHWRFQNQYVLVTEVTLASGESTLFHTHTHDNISVELSNAITQRQFMGKEWQPASEVKIGEATYREGDKQPYTHRVKNAGATTFRVIDVELLQ
jgi:quercetin dioxygenase-like cupin family protein